jgi:hypothetical protein
LAERGVSEGGGKGGGLLTDVERLPRPGRRNHLVGLLREAIETVDEIVVRFKSPECRVEVLEERLPTIELLDRQAVLERNAADAERLAGLGSLAGGQGRIAHSKIAGFRRRVRNGDVRGEFTGAPQLLDDHRSVTGELQRRQGTVACIHILAAEFMRRQRMADSPEQGELVQDGGEPGEVFAELDAGDSGGDRLELSAVLTGGVGLGVERIEMRRSAGKIDEDGGGRFCSGGVARFRPAKEVAERAGRGAQDAGLEEIASNDAVAGAVQCHGGKLPKGVVLASEAHPSETAPCLFGDVVLTRFRVVLAAAERTELVPFQPSGQPVSDSTETPSCSRAPKGGRAWRRRGRRIPRSAAGRARSRRRRDNGSASAGRPGE